MNNNSSQDNINQHLNKSQFSWKEPTIIVAIIGGIVTLITSFITVSTNILDKNNEQIKLQKQIEVDKIKEENKLNIKVKEKLLD